MLYPQLLRVHARCRPRKDVECRCSPEHQMQSMRSIVVRRPSRSSRSVPRVVHARTLTRSRLITRRTLLQSYASIARVVEWCRDLLTDRFHGFARESRIRMRKQYQLDPKWTRRMTTPARQCPASDRPRRARTRRKRKHPVVDLTKRSNRRHVDVARRCDANDTRRARDHASSLDRHL
jgi:hypothetical protein